MACVASRGSVKRGRARAGMARAERGHAGRAVVAGHAAVDARTGRAFEQGRAIGVQDQDGGLGRVDDAADLRACAFGVERHPDLAAGQHGQQRRDVLGAVAGADGDAALRRGVDVDQRGRQRRRPSAASVP